MAESVAGKTALITGASKRLGRATALALAGEGVNIVVHYRASAAAAEELAAELAARGVQAWPMAADLADLAGHDALIAQAREVAGSLDILINNASIFAPDTIAQVTFDAVLRNAQVNAWAPFALSRAFAGQVGRGKIVNLLDAKVKGHDPAHVSYILSKHLLAVLTRMTALEFAPDITVNAVAPALILPPAGKDYAYLDQLAARVPLKRHGDPQDIADAIVFLVKSAYITGQVIYVDGGWHLNEGREWTES